MDKRDMPINDQIMSCFQAMQTMDSLYEEYARRNGLTYMSLYILETLYELGECTQKRISDTTLYPKQTVNMVVRSFMKKELVTLIPGEGDRRNKLVRLTETGERFARKIIDPYWSAAERAFSELGASERSAMTRALTQFSHSLAKNVRAL